MSALIVVLLDLSFTTTSVHAEVIRSHMRKDLRELVGLGSPPTAYTTNASEALNLALRRVSALKNHNGLSLSSK